MDQQSKRPPRRRDDRIILQFDYDCFYAQVLESKNPALKSRPVGVKQKNILATCNYNARKHGVNKLMLISEAKKLCPSLVLVDGEDLTPFRDMSKIIFNFLRSYSWNGKAEKLGFDEVFMDVTDIVEYNMFCINRASMKDSFFCLAEKDPENGFACDLTSMPGCVAGRSCTETDKENPTYMRLLLGSHLGNHLRVKLEEEFGYTSTCGISTNKLLSKLVGSKNKPQNQTTLMALSDEDVLCFMDSHTLRKIPGLGSRMVHLIESKITSQELEAEPLSFDSVVTAKEARLHPAISPGLLEVLLGGPGAEKGVGSRVWALLHGIDTTEVKEASAVPSQISIEDTYKGLETLPRITEELYKLSCSLIRRMRVDLVITQEDVTGDESQRRWIARPKTLRLSTRSWPRPDSNQTMSFSRISRSSPLPSFIFDLKTDIEEIAEQLVSDALLPLLRRLHSERGHKWNLQLINICVANMITGATDEKTGAGRDIAIMFKRQDEVLRPWRITSVSDDDDDNDDDDEEGQAAQQDTDFEETDNDMSWESTDHTICTICGHSMPTFAHPAHLRYHELGE